MKKIRSSKKGFTLAELLIVVAIIGVLVGISIPIFSAQLLKSKIATNQANGRAAKAAAVADYLDKADTDGATYTYTVADGTIALNGAGTVAGSDGVCTTIGVTITDDGSGSPTVTVAKTAGEWGTTTTTGGGAQS